MESTGFITKITVRCFEHLAIVNTPPTHRASRFDPFSWGSAGSSWPHRSSHFSEDEAPPARGNLWRVTLEILLHQQPAQYDGETRLAQEIALGDRLLLCSLSSIFGESGSPAILFDHHRIRQKFQPWRYRSWTTQTEASSIRTQGTIAALAASLELAFERGKSLSGTALNHVVLAGSLALRSAKRGADGFADAVSNLEAAQLSARFESCSMRARPARPSRGAIRGPE